MIDLNAPIIDSPAPGSLGGLAVSDPSLLIDPQSIKARQAHEAEDDTTFAAMVRRRYDEGERARKTAEKSWKESIAFIEGIQYIIADIQTPVWLNIQANGKPGSERVIDNVLYDHSLRLLAQLTKPSYAPAVSAMTDMPEDYDASRIGQALCRHAFHLQKVSTLKRRLAWWIIVCGPAWIETYFDPDDGEGGRAGMVLRSPFQVVRDPRFTEWERCRWAIVTETAARSDVLDRFAESYKARTGKNLAQELPKDTKVKINVWMPEAAVRPGADATGVYTPPPDARDAVLVKRYYERPSTDHPNGRHGVVVENTTVHRSDLDTPLGHAIPLTPFGYWNRPWELEGRSPVSLCINLQRLANYSLGRWYEHIKRWAAGYLMKDTLSGITRGSITNQPDIITHNPGHAPKFEFPPFGNTSAYQAFRAAISASIESRMALPPINEKTPKGAKAAKTLELLREMSEELNGAIIADLADAWTEVWKQMLGWMQAKYTSRSITSIVGADKQGIAMNFQRGSIPDEWQDRLLVTVDTGGALPTGRLARMQTVLELSRKDLLFGRPGTPEHARQLRQALGFDPGYLESETDLDRAIAQQENTYLRGGQMLKVNVYDDDETHIAEHMAYIKQLAVQGESGPAVSTVMAHINLHRQQLAEKHKQMPAVAEMAARAGEQPFGAQGQSNTQAPAVRTPMGQG